MADEPKPIDWNKWIGIVIAILLAVLTQMGVIVSPPRLPVEQRQTIEDNAKKLQVVGEMFNLE